jgi:hypothetical protein
MGRKSDNRIRENPRFSEKAVTDSSCEELTELLVQARQGDKAAATAVAARVNDCLRTIARRFLAGERKGHTHQPTAIVNEAWIALIAPDGRLAVPDLASRGHFMQLRRAQCAGSSWTIRSYAHVLCINKRRLIREQGGVALSD